ncbi:MAG: enoyl-CoA hydratase/isomerase family protein [Paracoccaceae bacterium]
MSALHLDIDGPLATLRLDNPAKLNVLNVEMLAALDAHCADLERNSGIRVVLLTATGERAFCVGADINEWSKLTPTGLARNWVRDGHRIIDRLARLAIPTIAVLNGHAFGGGLELAAACDIRIMAPHATLGLPEAGIGVVPGWSGTQRLRRLLPEAALKEMALFGRRLSAGRALALGLVAEVSDNPLDTAKSIAQASLSQSPRATEIAKYMIHAGAGEDRAANIEALAGGMIAATDDKFEGVQAFAEKREPNFSGS